jgi:PAS domain S-box-containing protein
MDTNEPLISPNFSKSDIETLKRYFEFNKRYYEKINAELRPELAEHPVFGPLIKSQTPEQQKIQNEKSLERQRAAIFDGKWEEYSRELITQGITYAKMNIGYEDWYSIIKLYKDHLIPHIKKDFPGSEEVISFLDGLTMFIDYAMYGIAEAYFSEKNNTIRAKEELFRAIYDNSADSILLVDKNLNIVMVNHIINPLFKKEDIIGKPILSFQLPENVVPLKNAIEKAFKTKVPFILETEGKVGERKIYYSSSISPIFGPDGEVDNVIFISRDVSAQKRSELDIKEMNANLEIKVNERTAELKKINSELEQFAYVASHDLQEPLRTITNYVKLFQNKYKEKIDEDSDIYLNFITEATARMQTLIRDLLEYSRIGHDKNISEIDCNKLMQDITNDLNQAIKDSGAEIKSEQLPVIHGYSDLKSLFQNLIMNAIKFQKKDSKPVITITAQGTKKEWLFAVKDNGIGIEKIYQDKIFIIFQKLHTQREYPGTGIGLAQCKKIVELHGGKIWVESEAGQGSTFYFTIPKTTTV